MGSDKYKEEVDNTSNSRLRRPSRLELLKRKLAIEQEMFEGGNADETELDEINRELESDRVGDSNQDSKSSITENQLNGGKNTYSDNRPAEFVEDMVHKIRRREPVHNPLISIEHLNEFPKRIKAYQTIFENVRREVGKIVVGQQETVMGFLRALIADGHVLVEGVPGIAKTTLIRALAKTTSCMFSRIQFTPDLLPTDIIGISTYQEGKGFYTLKGPIFNNFILADEINRAPPKVQSALLECMAEKQATIAKQSFPVPLPFFTMATQNPLENVGTYSLPEAQVDRFLFKLYMGYPNIDEEQKILNSNINTKSFDNFDIHGILSPDAILHIQEEAKRIYVDKRVEMYIVKVVDATRNPKKYNISLGKYVEFGASPRASIGIFTASKAEALLNGQTYVTPHHTKTVAYDVLRHRIILSYEGQAEGIKSEQFIQEILKKVPVP